MGQSQLSQAPLSDVYMSQGPHVRTIRLSTGGGDKDKIQHTVCQAATFMTTKGQWEDISHVDVIPRPY